MTRSRKLLLGIGVVAVLLVAGRLALPYVVKDYVNGKLAALDAYDGRVGDIDIHLWRGAYSIDDIVIEKTGASRPVPFFKGDRVNFSVEWKSLWKGSIVSEVEFLSPELNLVQGKSDRDSQLGQEENWNARLEELFPFRFNTIEAHNGTVRFVAPGISTGDAITARRVEGRVTNLTNVIESGKETFADFKITAEVLEGAPAVVAGSVNAFAATPTFDVNLEVKKVQLPQVNPWLREFIKADAEAGDFELYMEIAAAEGKFKGYAKPILQNVDMYRSGEEEQSALKRVWEGFLDFAAEVLENDQADQVAARIPFTGTIENPETSLFATISSVLRNAFISAFARSLEGSINLRDVKDNLGELGDDKVKFADEGGGKDGKRGQGQEGDEAGDSGNSGERVSQKPKPGPPGKTL
jgi:hypothetical protein